MAIGVTRADLDLLIGAGYSTIARWAFSSNYTPGVGDDAPFREVLRDALGRDPAAAEVAVFRRLLFECWTLAAGDLRSRLERGEAAGPRPVAAPERAARHAAQCARLVGVNVTGELEASHRLLDEVNDQLEQNSLKWAPYERLTKRDAEVQRVRADPELKLDAAGSNLKITNKEDRVLADTSTDLRLKNALMRRAIAYDHVGLLTYSVHVRWVEFLFESLLRVSPPGYSQVLRAQLLKADQELWKLIAERTLGGLALQVGPPRPLDQALDAQAVHPRAVSYTTLKLAPTTPHSVLARVPAFTQYINS